MRIFISGPSLFLAAMIGGCSDPASEQPVSLKPGLYQVTIDRTVLGPIKASSQSTGEGAKCVGSGSSDLEWIYPAIERKFCPECSCSTKDKTRTGNAISAHAVCPHDDDGTFGALEYAYQGVVSDEGVTLEGKVKSGLATYVAPDATDSEKADAARVAEKWESVTLAARIDRVGDCPG
jgi:hypothetical protein